MSNGECPLLRRAAVILLNKLFRLILNSPCREKTDCGNCQMTEDEAAFIVNESIFSNQKEDGGGR